MGGWYDYYAGVAFDSFNRVRKNGATNEVRVVISPSDHLNHVGSEMDFGSDAHKDEVGLAIQWLDYVIK